MPDFSYKSKFNKEANFTSILFGADAPLLETELNELQDILLHKIRNVVKLGFRDGIVEEGYTAYDGNTFQISGAVISFEGDLIYISNSYTQAKIGDSIYLKVSEEEADFQTPLKKYGNKQESAITNHLLDVRVNQETSRRYVLTYELTTVQPSRGIKIGEIKDVGMAIGVFENTMPKAKPQPAPTIGKERPIYGGMWYELIE
jgi:hypothetical protein